YAGFAACMCYVLVLLAMNYVTNVSFVQAFRQIGLVFGMAGGFIFLKEKCTITKIVGIVLILSGLAISILN
ncbi:MAG: multidrug transporter, partial [Lentisphaeria bacterium]|nr:multidrug transporter [Lentisphaeria bacterium]